MSFRCDRSSIRLALEFLCRQARCFPKMNTPKTPSYASNFLQTARRNPFRKDFVLAVFRVQTIAALLLLSVSMLPDFVQIIPEEDPNDAREEQTEHYQPHVHSSRSNRRLSLQQSDRSYIKQRIEVDSVLLHTVCQY